jgi:hypothetical protein
MTERTVLLEKLVVAPLVKKLYFMEPESSLPSSQEPASGPYPEPLESNPHPQLCNSHLLTGNFLLVWWFRNYLCSIDVVYNHYVTTLIKCCFEEVVFCYISILAGELSRQGSSYKCQRVWHFPWYEAAVLMFRMQQQMGTELPWKYCIRLPKWIFGLPCARFVLCSHRDFFQPS